MKTRCNGPDIICDSGAILGHIAHAIFFCIMLATASICFGTSYSAKAIEGWVVDAETGKPISNAVVLAHWELQGPMEGQAVGQVNILETTSDQDGRYYFAEWGPKYVPDPTAVLFNRDPMLHYFKSGYELRTLTNRARVDPEYTSMTFRTSRWDGMRIPLKDFHGDNAANSESLFTSTIEIRRLTEFGTECEWRSMKTMLQRLLQERRRLEALGFHPSFPDAARFSQPQKCGSAEPWLSEGPK